VELSNSRARRDNKTEDSHSVMAILISTKPYSKDYWGDSWSHWSHVLPLQEFSMIFADGTGALHHVLDGEMEPTSIIGTGEAFLERLDEFIKGGELGGRQVFRH